MTALPSLAAARCTVRELRPADAAGRLAASAFAAPGRACNAEVGWWIGRALWGRGLVVEALGVFVPWLWRERPALTRLAATIYARNRRSMRVAEKAGWVRESVQPRSIVKAGEILDAVVYATYREPRLSP